MPRTPSRGGAFLIACCALFSSRALFPETVRWFVSDGAGIAYESVTRAVALRSDWALELRTVEADEALGAAEGLAAGEIKETRILYRQGEKERTAVSFLGASGSARLNETRESDGSLSRTRYDSRNRPQDEISQASDGTGIIVKYRWTGDRLFSAVAYALENQAGEPLWTETYRYDRSGALRSVSREPESSEFLHDSRGGTPRFIEIRAADGSAVRTSFDERGREVETATIDADGKTISSVERVAYAKAEGSKSKGSSRRVKGPSGETIETQYDEKARAVRVLRFDAEGKVVETTETEWTGERVSSVTRAHGEEVRKSEFAYDGRGKRVSEKNYLNGRLERYVRKEGVMETEELYKNGAPVLRAEYEGGVLLRETRFRLPSGEGGL